MNKSIYVISLILFSAVFKVNSLQCYVCDNCTTVEDGHLQTCGAAPSTTTLGPEATTPSSTNTPATDSSTNNPNPDTTQTSNTANGQSTAQTTNLGIEVLYPDYEESKSKLYQPSKLLTTRVKREDIFDFIRADNESYVCWVESETVNGTTTVSRGCGINKTCDGDQPSVQCRICEADKCNTASSLKVSAILLNSAFFLYLMFQCYH